MKRLFSLKLITHHGTSLVLVALCAYYSVITWDVHNPETPRAARQLAGAIAGDYPGDPSVLILARNTAGDERYASALHGELNRHGANVVDVVLLDDPYPANARRVLEQLADSSLNVDVIATHHPGSRWGPLNPKKLKQLAGRVSVLRNTRVHKPASYKWPTFLTRGNLLNVINVNAEVFIIAIGMTMVIVTAGIDLSVGSMLALAGVLTAVLLQTFGGGANASLVAITVCVVIGIGVSTLCGAFSGTMVTVFHMPAFVVTLALMMIARGLAYIVDVRYNSMQTGGTAAPVAVNIEADSFGWIGGKEMLGIPNPILLMILLYVLAHVVMTRTIFGRYVYAVGGNAEAARLSGVPVRLVIILVYTICGALTGLAGIVNASRFGSGDPGAGDLYELQVIAAVVVGGTSLGGGQGRITGTLVGAMIIAVIENGLNMAGIGGYEQKVVFGLLILVAVLLDQLKKWKGGG